MDASLIDAINEALSDIVSRLSTLERVYGRIMQLDMRLETLEFNSNVPIKPSLAEKMFSFDLRLEKLENAMKDK